MLGARAVPDRPSRNGLTSHLPKIVDRYRQLLALDALDEGRDLRVAGSGEANLRALVDDVAIDEFDLGASPLQHVLAHGGTLQFAASAARRFLDEYGIHFLEGGGIAATRQNQLCGIELADLLELIAEGLADPHRLTADFDGEMADVLVLIDLAPCQAGGRRHAIPHGVVTELRPALPPEIRRHLGAIDGAQQFGDTLGTLGGEAVDLADAEHRMRGRAFRRLSTHLAGLEQLDGNARSDASQRASPPDDTGDALLVDAVLQRNHVAAGRQIRLDELCHPLGVVRLHAHEGDVHRRLPGERSNLVQVHGFRMRNLPLLRRHPGEFETVPANRFDILGPAVDQRDIVAMRRQMSAHIAADGAAAEHDDPLTHDVLPIFLPRIRRSAGQTNWARWLSSAARISLALRSTTSFLAAGMITTAVSSAKMMSPGLTWTHPSMTGSLIEAV